MAVFIFDSHAEAFVVTWDLGTVADKNRTKFRRETSDGQVAKKGRRGKKKLSLVGNPIQTPVNIALEKPQNCGNKRWRGEMHLGMWFQHLPWYVTILSLEEYSRFSAKTFECLNIPLSRDPSQGMGIAAILLLEKTKAHKQNEEKKKWKRNKNNTRKKEQ